MGFDEEAMRGDLRETLTVTRDFGLEVIMKDTHTVENDPGRLPRWAQIARQETG